QYVAYVTGPSVSAFKLGGSLKRGVAPKLPPPAEGIVGPIEDTNHIDTASLMPNLADLGQHWFVDEQLFGPFRARVEAGTRVTFKNNSGLNHTIIAQDGSWSTPTLEPSDAAVVTFDKPGMYTYICKEHPWSYGQIIVVAKGLLNSTGGGSGAALSGDQV